MTTPPSSTSPKVSPLKETPTLLRGLKFVIAFATIGILFVLPFSLRPYGLYLMTTWAVFAIAAQGLNLTLGYAGQISLAQAAFLGIGAYCEAVLTAHGVPFFAAFAVSGILCFLIGWGLGYPALRVQHHYLAFVTLAFATLAYLVFRNEEWLTGGIYGISNIKRPELFGYSFNKALDFYFFTLAVMIALSFTVWWMLRSPWGRAFTALRENPIRALSLGIDTRTYTLLAFALGSALAGLAGALYAPLVQFIEPNAFALNISFSFLLMVIVGGSGYFYGPYVGALVSVILPEWLRGLQDYYLMLFAIVVMILMAFCPTGILGLFTRLGEAFWPKPPAATPVIGLDTVPIQAQGVNHAEQNL